MKSMVTGIVATCIVGGTLFSSTSMADEEMQIWKRIPLGEPTGGFAMPADLSGDGREELVLYQPYHGRVIYIFVQPDSDMATKSYHPQQNAYNRPASF